jgi:hypothetical protein
MNERYHHYDLEWENIIKAEEVFSMKTYWGVDV